MKLNTVYGVLTEEGDDITIWMRCRTCNECGEWCPSEVVNKSVVCSTCKNPLEYAYISIIPKGHTLDLS